MEIPLPELKFEYNALEPYIDAKTMEIHHTKHHQGYINNFITALKDHQDLQEKSLIELLSNIDTVPEDIRTAVRNNGGGHFNHSLFWEILTPNKSEPSEAFSLKLNEVFTDFETFKNTFYKAATTRFGSGWAWLVIGESNSLEVVSTANQDSPIMSKQKPILGLDVWEHAYYLNYQNRRGEYVDNFWHIVNWEQVEKNYNQWSNQSL